MPTEPPDHPPAGDQAPVPLSFPDTPRLELDALLGQLVERAQEVMSTQGRLRTLLRGNRSIGGDLDLPNLLAHAAAARELIGARYAALGVADPNGGLAEFIHDGMDADTVARIGRQRLVGAYRYCGVPLALDPPGTVRGSGAEPVTALYARPRARHMYGRCSRAFALDRLPDRAGVAPAPSWSACPGGDGRRRLDSYGVVKGRAVQHASPSSGQP